MAVYNSKFATRNVAPSAGRNHPHVKRFAAALLATAVVALGAFGFWRATLGVPEPGQSPAIFTE